MTALMALDIIIRYKSTIHNTVYGRSFFTSDDNKKISNGIELWRGYYQACKATESGVYINVDTTATAFYQSGSLIDVITSVIARRSREELRMLDDYSKRKIKSFIKGLYITTSHRGPQRKFRIKDLSQDSASNIEFKVNGEVKTVSSYFRDTYNIHLYFDFLPCVVVGRDINLPIELCNVVPGQKYPRKLNELQTSDMIKFTCLNPSIRSNKIRNAIDFMNYKDNEYLKVFDIKIGRDFIEAPSKLLSPPSLTYRSQYNQSESSLIPVNGKWRINENLLFTKPIKSVCVISFCPRELDEMIVRNFFRDLFAVCRRMGMKFQLDSPFISTSNPHGNIKNELVLSTRNACKEFGASPDIIFAILPNSGTYLYNKLKTFSDKNLGIPTQCIQSRHVISGRGNRQYCTNIGYKINTKTGGINTELSRSDIKIISSSPTMIIGIDLNQPSKVESRNQSIVTLVASQNETASKYKTYVEYQSDKHLVVHDIRRISIKIFSDFNKMENYIPNRVIIYRDGLSDGQFDQTLNYEVSRIHNGFNQVFPNEALNITYIVVQKRHHIRFFPMNIDHRDESGNCSPGTIVNSVITEPGRPEFFLQSHSGIKGTSRSAHYYILLNENRFEIEDIQKLSYYLCYTNARCTRSVSLVPPISYANLMSTRAKCYDQANYYASDYEGIDRKNTESLSDILYYI
jgi:eukaryotic translation initiation factor 2C